MLIRSSWMVSSQLQSVSRVRRRLLSLLLSFHRVCTQERYCENRVCIREIEEQLPQSRREREREIVRDKRLSRRERLIGVAIGSKGLRPSILISIIVGPRWNPLSNLSLFLPPSTSTRTPAGHRNYASFHRCYSSLIQIMLRSITERERGREGSIYSKFTFRGGGHGFDACNFLAEKVSRIREKGWGNFMGRGNLIQNSLQLTPFNRRESWNRERERNSARDTTGIDLPSLSPPPSSRFELYFRQPSPFSSRPIIILISTRLETLINCPLTWDLEQRGTGLGNVAGYCQIDVKISVEERTITRLIPLGHRPGDLNSGITILPALRMKSYVRGISISHETVGDNWVGYAFIWTWNISQRIFLRGLTIIIVSLRTGGFLWWNLE